MGFNTLKFPPFETEIFCKEDFLASSVTDHSLMYEASQRKDFIVLLRSSSYNATLMETTSH